MSITRFDLQNQAVRKEANRQLAALTKQVAELTAPQVEANRLLAALVKAPKAT